LPGPNRDVFVVEGALPRVDVQVVGIDEGPVDVEQDGGCAAPRFQGRFLATATGRLADRG
jgi:hypothetical protein